MILQQQEIKLLCNKDNRIFWTSTTTFTSCLVLTIHGANPFNTEWKWVPVPYLCTQDKLDGSHFIFLFPMSSFVSIYQHHRETICFVHSIEIRYEVFRYWGWDAKSLVVLMSLCLDRFFLTNYMIIYRPSMFFF